LKTKIELKTFVKFVFTSFFKDFDFFLPKGGKKC